MSPFKDSNEKWPDLLPLGIVGIHEAGSRWYWTGGQYRAVALLHLSWWDGMSSCKESNHPRISMSQIKSSIIVQTRSMGSCKDSQGLCASTWFSLHWFVFCYIVCVCVLLCVCACGFFFVCVCVECSLSLLSGTAIVIPSTIQIIQDIRRLIVPDTCKTMEWDIRTSQRRRGDSHLASRGHRELWIPFCHPVGPGNEKWQVWTCFQDSGHRHPDARALFQNACIRYAARWAVDRWVCRTYRSDEGCRLSNRCADSHSGDSIASEACQKVCVKVHSSSNSSMRWCKVFLCLCCLAMFCHRAVSQGEKCKNSQLECSKSYRTSHGFLDPTLVYCCNCVAIAGCALSERSCLLFLWDAGEETKTEATSCAERDPWRIARRLALVD